MALAFAGDDAALTARRRADVDHVVSEVLQRGLGYHFSAKDWGEDLRRQNALHGERLVLLRFSVRRLRAERRQCGAEIARLVA